MAKFTYSMKDAEAILALKKTFLGNGGPGNIPVLREKDNLLVVGAPFMTVKIKFNNGVCETKARLFGKVMKKTVETKIELTDGFKK